MRVVLVTGTRDLPPPDPGPVWRELDHLEAELIIHGADRGVDAAADEWARHRHVDVISVEAEWERYGKSAGARRNARLVAKAVQYLAAGHDMVCLAVPGPRSVGTHDCAQRAEQAGIRVRRVAV